MKKKTIKLRNFTLIFVLLIGNIYSKDSKVNIRDKFLELESGIFFYVNEKDPFLRPYKNNGYTVDKYIREKIHPVVKDFLAINNKGDIGELSNYIGENTIEEFAMDCQLKKVEFSSTVDYRKLLFKDLQSRNYSCGISSYFGLYNLFNVKKEDVFFFEKKYYFLVWLYPRYKQGKNKQYVWETPPSFDELEHGSTFVMYYLKEPSVIVSRYLFEFKPDSKKYEISKYYPDFTESFVENYQYEK